MSQRGVIAFSPPPHIKAHRVALRAQRISTLKAAPPADDSYPSSWLPEVVRKGSASSALGGGGSTPLVGAGGAAPSEDDSYPSSWLTAAERARLRR